MKWLAVGLSAYLTKDATRRYQVQLVPTAKSEWNFIVSGGIFLSLTFIYLVFSLFVKPRNERGNYSAEGYSENGIMIGPFAYVTFHFG